MFKGPGFTAADSGYHRAAKKLSDDPTRQTLSNSFSTTASPAVTPTPTASVAQEIVPNQSFQAPTINTAATRVTTQSAVNPGQVSENKQNIGASREQTQQVKNDYVNTMKEAGQGLQQSTDHVAQKQGINPGNVHKALGSAPSTNLSAGIELATKSVPGLDIATTIMNIAGARKAVTPGELNNIVDEAKQLASSKPQGPAAFPGKENANAPAAPEQFAYENLSTGNAKTLLQAGQGEHALQNQPEMQALDDALTALDQAEQENDYAAEHGNKTANAENIAAAIERDDTATLEKMGITESASEVFAMADLNISGNLKVPSFVTEKTEAYDTIAQHMEPDVAALGGDFGTTLGGMNGISGKI